MSCERLTRVACGLALLVLWACQGQCEPPPDEAESHLVIKKCCAPHETFSLANYSCIAKTDEEIEDEDVDSIVPMFVSGGWVDFEIDRNGGFPTCNPDTERLSHLLNIDGMEDLDAAYFIDDSNITGRLYSLFDLKNDALHEEFCMDSAQSRGGVQTIGTIASVCQTRDEIICQNMTCVSFCCSSGKYYDIEADNCVAHPDGSYAQIQFVSAEDKSQPVEVDPDRTKLIFNNLPTCSRLHKYSKFSLLETGKVDVGVGRMSGVSEYCIERYGKYDPEKMDIVLIEPNPVQVIVCAPEDPIDDGYFETLHLVDYTLTPTLFIISLIFLVLLFIFIYVKNRHKLFGAMTLCLVAMLIAFYVLLLIAKFSGDKLHRQLLGLCICIGLALQFSYLSAMFWLNAMSFDIWSTFRHMMQLPQQNIPKMGWQHKRFKWYALYSWGCPLIVVLVTLIMQLIPESAMSPSVTKPGIGERRCFLDSTWAMILYLNIIVAPLLCINIFFFISSIYNLLCGVWADKSGDPVMRAQHKTRHKTVIKMFFAMGIPWLAEAVSFILDWRYGRSKVLTLTIIFKVINGLQGLILFLVIVFDSAMIELIKYKVFGIEPSTARTASSSRPSRTSFTSGLSTSFRKISQQMVPERFRKKSESNRTKENGQESLELRATSKSPPPIELHD